MIDLGDGRTLTWQKYKDDERSACKITHRKPDGAPCHHHYCPIEGGAWAGEFSERIAQWKIVNPEPLTLSPSILCLGCGDHGFVENGKWRKA